MCCIYVCIYIELFLNYKVYCSLTDTARRIREMMFQLKIRNIAVLDKGAVVGVQSGLIGVLFL